MPVDAENPRQLNRRPRQEAAPPPDDVMPIPTGNPTARKPGAGSTSTRTAAPPRGRNPIPADQWNAMSRAEQRAIAQGPTRRNPGGTGGTPAPAPPPAGGPMGMSPGGGQTPAVPTMGGPGNFVAPDAGPGGYGPAPGGMGGGSPWGAYLPPGMGGQQPSPGYGDPYSVTDPFEQFMAAVPVMNLNRDKQISDSMAEAGFGGNRYGSFAAGKAAEIGGQTALQQDALLWKMLSDYGNQTQDRALQAQGLGLQAAGLQDQMAMNRLQLPFQMAQYEQGRQDNFSNTAFQDWSQNRLGWMGPLLQAAMSQGAGSPGQIYTTQTPSQPGVADYLPLLMSLFGGG